MTTTATTTPTLVAVSITPRPITAQVDPARVVAYLVERRWSEVSRSDRFIEYELHPSGDENYGACGVPLTNARARSAAMVECIADIARAEGRHPTDVLADLLPPVAPSAWAALSEEERGDALHEVQRRAKDYGEAGLPRWAAALRALAELGRAAR